MSSSDIKIYTDGSCSPNPGPGGWGAVVVFKKTDKVVEIQGTEKDSTNNRMELMAALQALQSLGDQCAVDIFTDSRYLQRGVTEWLESWKRNGWMTSERLPVKNKDLWELLAVQLKRHRVKWQWVKGHSEDSMNARADELAVAARKSQHTHVEDPDVIKLYTGVTWKSSSNVGAWATILSYKQHSKIIGGSASGSTTANQLYLVAVIEGIKALKMPLPVHVYTQSGYLRDGLETWLEGWEKRDWCTREGTSISNKEQWQKLSKFKKEYQVSVAHVSSEEPPCRVQEAKELAREFE